MHWSEINPNPDHLEVVNYRNEKVSALYKKAVDGYEELIKSECSGKNVIDFGAANHTSSTQSISENDTHSIVVKYASSVSAVDIVEFSQTCPDKCSHFVGNFIVQESLPFGKADVIFAGHVIEHLDSPHLLFKFGHKALKKNGRLVIVTPNPLWFVGLFYRSLGQNTSVNADHVSLFGASELIELGERNNYELTSWYYSGRSDMPVEFRPGGRIVSRIINLIYRTTRLKNMAFAHNQIVATFKKVS
jgi:SAM-dependent methyltransferase